MDRRCRHTISLALALAVASATLPGCATNPVTGHHELSLVSPQQEMQIGKEGYPAVLAEYGAYGDPRLAAYVDTIGHRVARVSHMPDLDWHFTLLDDPTVNAFAMPGGYIYITRGILAHLNSEAQLAGVLGHEIGHVTARHSAAQITKQQIYGLGLGLATAFSPTLQRYSGPAQQALGLLFLKYSRDNETQADELGVMYATKAGYDPHEIPLTYVMLRRVGEQGGQRMPAFLSTHPDPGDREVRTTELARAASAGKTGLVVRNRDYVKRLDGVVFGPDPRQGYFEGTRFIQPDLAFEITFPSGWQTQNTKSAVAAAAPDKSGAMQLSLAQDKSGDPVRHVQELATSGKIASFDGKKLDYNGMPAWAGHVIVKGSDGQPVPLAAAFVADGESMYQMLGQAANDETPIFTAMASFKKVKDAALTSVQPARVKVLTVPKTQPFSALVQAQGAQAIDVNAESILNNVDPDAPVAEGTMVKIVPKPH